MPAGIFRLITTATERNPTWLSQGRNWSTSKQVKDYFLCEQCESRFDRLGEKIVLPQCLRRSGAFPLRDSVLYKLGSPIGVTSFGASYSSAALGSLVDALIYFGVSVFWRAAAHDWAATKNFTRLKLPPLSIRKFRQFLRGEASFPRDSVLVVGVIDGTEEIYCSSVFPRGLRRGRYYSGHFIVPGIRFDLYVGSGLRTEDHNACIVRGPGNPIFVVDPDTAVTRVMMGVCALDNTMPIEG